MQWRFAKELTDLARENDLAGVRHRGDVLAFASAPPAQGGAGAVLVLLDNR